jgi:hypothetical protein
MNAPRLTDAQVSQALRAHLPERAQAGLRERILEAAEMTGQQRALPSFLGALTEADSVTRRRSLLIAAALLVALALAATAAVGALRLLERDPVQDLSVAPPADVPAFVLSSYDRMPELPPVAMTWVDGDGAKGRIYVHRSGAVRFDRFASAETTEPTSSTILRDNHLSGLAVVGTDRVWVEQQDEAFGEDPRVFIHAEIGSGSISFGEPGCETSGEADQAGTGRDASGWRYVGAESVAGRPAYHFACGGDLWLDIETRVILRARAPLPDDAGQPIPGAFRTIEVTEIAFGEQPSALFEPPEGVARMPIEAYHDYLCTHEPVSRDEFIGWAREGCPEPPPPEYSPLRGEATPLPTSTPNASARPSPSGPAGPLVWSEARLDEDWPVPVRHEPAGGAVVVPPEMVQRPWGESPIYPDPVGDTGSDDLPWIDIREVYLNETGSDLWIELATNPPPAVDPSQLWIAFGLVLDTDRDGVPDVRYGMDNQPGREGAEVSDRRAWRTDLDTGRTVAGTEYGFPGGTFLHISWPGVNESNGMGALFDFGGDATGGGTFGSRMEAPLYAWASVIENGRVLATDYAPDVGWLDPSATAKP